MTSLQDLLNHARALDKRLEAELLLSDVLNVSKEAIFAHPERELSVQEVFQFELLWERIGKGEPLAYVLGKKEFFGLEFNTDERALIPRPETEHLVETVIDLVKGIGKPRILDVGTGCGAIALALQNALPNAVVRGSDVSGEAIELARENGEQLGLQQVEFFVSNLLKDLSKKALEVDVLVANLPYIGKEKFHFVEKSVEDHEPHVALFGGFDGLQLYGQFFDQINCSTKGVKWVLGEFGSLQRPLLQEMIERAFPEGKVTFHTDLAGLDRYFVIQLV